MRKTIPEPDTETEPDDYGRDDEDRAPLVYGSSTRSSTDELEEGIAIPSIRKVGGVPVDLMCCALVFGGGVAIFVLLFQCCKRGDDDVQKLDAPREYVRHISARIPSNNSEKSSESILKALKEEAKNTSATKKDVKNDQNTSTSSKEVDVANRGKSTGVRIRNKMKFDGQHEFRIGDIAWKVELVNLHKERVIEVVVQGAPPKGEIIELGKINYVLPESNEKYPNSITATQLTPKGVPTGVYQICENGFCDPSSNRGLDRNYKFKIGDRAVYAHQEKGRFKYFKDVVVFSKGGLKGTLYVFGESDGVIFTKLHGFRIDVNPKYLYKHTNEGGITAWDFNLPLFRNNFLPPVTSKSGSASRAVTLANHGKSTGVRVRSPTKYDGEHEFLIGEKAWQVSDRATSSGYRATSSQVLATEIIITGNIETDGDWRIFKYLTTNNDGRPDHYHGTVYAQHVIPKGVSTGVKAWSDKGFAQGHVFKTGEPVLKGFTRVVILSKGDKKGTLNVFREKYPNEIIYVVNPRYLYKEYK